MVVFASFMIHVIADGVMYSFGVFYVDLNKYFGSTKAESAWIASIMTCVTFGAGPLVSALVNRYGCRPVSVMGSVVSALAFVISTRAESVETMYVTLGLMLGVGLGLMYLPAIVSVTCYFEKRRAFATGVAVCGSGIGTFVLSPLAEALLSKYGWQNTMLVLAAVLCSCSIFGFMLKPLEPDSSSSDVEVVKEVPTVKLCGAPDSVQTTISRHLTDSNLVEKLAEESSQTSTHLNSSPSERNDFRSSQPLLVKSEEKPESFGSHEIVPRYLSMQSRPASTHLELMRRKDIFYSGSLINIVSYRSDPQMYEKNVVNHQCGDKDTSCELCTCLSCPQDFTNTLKDMTGFSLLKHPVYMLFALSNFLTSVGYFVPYVYIVDKAITSGVGRKEASYLLSIIGISNTAARVVLGYISDRPEINRLYLYNSALFVSGLATALISSCSDFACLAFFAALFGLTIGAYVGLTSVLLVDLLGLDLLTNAFGLLLLFQGIASLIGPPLTGALYDATHSYSTGLILCGALVAISGLMLFFIPCLQSRWPAWSGGFTTPSPTASSTSADKQSATDTATASLHTTNSGSCPIPNTVAVPHPPSKNQDAELL